MRPILLVLAGLLAAPQALAQPDHVHTGHGVEGQLGSVVFPNSGNEAAQAPFLRGIALLHSFEYVDAAEAFRAAQEADPEFALAFWFEALTYRHPLWGEEDVDAARAALLRFGPTVGSRMVEAPPAERPWGEAVEALFAPGEEEARQTAYTNALRRLVAERPDDPEAAAFASVAAMGLSLLRPQAELDALLDEAAALATRVYEANPDHPGAAHYLIHAFDTPARAPRGVEAARAYARIAPAAQHALHMPSHIFVQLGLWDDAVASNERSWAASRGWVARRGASPSELDFHSLTWLQYGYLQQGRLGAAEAIIDTVRTLLGDDTSEYPDARYVGATLAFQLAAGTGRWEGVPSRPIDASQNESRRAGSFVAVHEYQVAAAAAMRGDTSTAVARRIRSRMAAMSELQRIGAEIRATQLEGLAARSAGDLEGAIERFRAALVLAPPPVGPPYVIPSEELLGEALIEAGLFAEAEAAYEAALTRRPNRVQALLGLARARAAGGDGAGAAEAYRQLLGSWHAADPNHPDLAEVRRGAGEQ